MEKKIKIRKTELYSHWIAMKGRCLCKNQPYYKNYGDRGIKVCDEWLHDSLSFFEWSYKNGYIEGAGLTLDRIDVNGDLNTQFVVCVILQKVEIVNGKNTDLHIDKSEYAIHLTNVREVF